MNNQAQTDPNRYLIISFHDLAPHCREECQHFIDRLHNIGIKNLSLLTVPYWHNQETIHDDPAFIPWLKKLQEQGCEIVLHGHSHKAESIQGGLWSNIIGRFYTNQEGEFYQISYETASEYLHRDRQLLLDAGIPVRGFIAPAWLLSKDACRAAEDQGFLYTTLLQHIQLFPSSRRIYAPTLVFSSRNAWRRQVSILWNRFWYQWNHATPVMRIAIHPIDMAYPYIEEILAGLIQEAAKSRTVVSYGDFVERIINS